MRKLMLALALAAAIVACDRSITAPPRAATTAPRKITCISGYVVTSGRDTTCAPSTMTVKP